MAIFAIGAAIAGTVALGSAIAKSRAAGKAADKATRAQLESTRMQVDELRRQFDRQMELMAPFIGRQNQAGRDFANLIGQNLSAASQHARGVFGGETDLAGRTPEEDLAIQRAEQTRLFGGIDQDALVQQARERSLEEAVLGRQLAPGALQDDERFRFAQGTEVVGREFEESPGFRFQLEEAERAGERALSRGGGNISGRAAIEAQRRAQGLAQQDYYNFVGARQRDLARQDAAAAAFQGRQAIDASRLDQATLGDIMRERDAIRDARRREELDVARGDAALQSFFGRRAGDVSRRDALLQSIMGGLGGLGGFGNFAGQAAGQTGAFGGALANVYGQQGSNLANIYLGQGAQQGQMFGDINQAAQGTISNLLLQNLLSGGGG